MDEFSENNALIFYTEDIPAVDISYSDGLNITEQESTHSTTTLWGNMYVVSSPSYSDWVKVTYNNIGTYDGKEVGAIVTYSKFMGLSKVEIAADSFYMGWWLYNTGENSYCTINLTLFYMDGSDSSSIGDYYIGFNSLNGGTAHEWAYNQEGLAYVSEDTNIKSYQLTVYGSSITVYGGEDNTFTDYLGGSTFYKNSVLFKVSGASNDFITGKYLEEAVSSNEWGGFSTTPLTAVEPDSPIKTVDGVTDIINMSVGDSITYKITQSVHTLGVNTLARYSDFVISDTLPAEVTYNESNPAYLTNEKGNVISDAGTVSFDSVTNTVTFTFNSTYLSSTMAMEGETYILVIPCVINSNADAGSTFSNEATVNFDDYPTITSNEVTVTMVGYDISTSVTHGTITESETNIDPGDSRTIYYSPKSGYQLDSVTIDGVSVDIKKYPSSYTFTNISSDHTINVVYIPYWKITTEVTNGTISDDVTEGITGEDYTIEYSPESGYLIDTVIVDGEEVDVTKYPDSYTFEDLDADHTITVTYAKPSASKEMYLYSSDFSSSYTSGQSIEGYVLVPGDVIEYKISYSNPTSATRTVTITDTLPSQLKPVSASDSGTISGQTVKWTLSVSAYSSGTVSVYAEVVDDGEFTNTASVTFKALSGSSNESDVIVEDSVTASAMDNPIKWAENESGTDVTDQVISAGDTLTYYIQFTNPSSDTKVFTITDTVPDGTTLVTGSISNGGSYSNGTITWTGISLAGGATTKVYFSVTVDEPSSELTQIPNQATVGVDNVEIDSVATVSLDDDDDYTWVYVLDDPVKVALSTDGDNLSDYQEIVTEGTYVIYEITTSNPAKNAKTFTITDPLPEYVTFVSCDNGGVYDSSTHTVVWEITVDAGESATVSVTVMVSYGSQGACFENVATVAVDNTTEETNPASIAVLPSPKKSVTLNGLDADNEPVNAGDTLVYGINYYNPSEYMKTFTITDYLPNEVTFVSADQGGTYDAATHSVTWKITMYGKTYNTVYVTVTVNEGTEGTAFDNHLAYVQVDGAELYTNKVTNWVGKKMVTSTDGTDLSGKTVSAGSTVVYTISTINTTGKDRYMQIYDNIPAGLTPVSASDGGVINGQEVTWNVLVEAGCLKTVTVTCTVNNGYNGKLVINTATVKGIYLTANVSDPGIYIGKETIATGIASAKTPYVAFTTVAFVAVISGIVLIMKKKRK